MAGKHQQPPKKQSGPIVLIILVVLLLAVLVFQIFWIFHLHKNMRSDVMQTEDMTAAATQPSTEQSTAEPETEPVTAPPTTEPSVTEPVTEPLAAEESTAPETTEALAVEQPQQLTALLQACGSDYDQLAQKNCTQLVTVEATGTTARVRMYTCTDGQWQEQTEFATDGRVGRGGVSAQKQEGDGCTPRGLFGIGSAFYIHAQPQTQLDIFTITEDTYWVDDPDSVFYNQRVEGTELKDWDSAEHMIDYDSYRYGFVVDYNLMAEYAAGSAIFFHIGSSPTSGCIAVSEDMVLRYLALLDKNCNPFILIA